MSCPIREACDVLSVGQNGDHHAWKLKDRRLDDAFTSFLRCWLHSSPSTSLLTPVCDLESSTKCDPSDTLASRVSRKAHETKQQKMMVLNLGDGYTEVGTFCYFLDF